MHQEELTEGSKFTSKGSSSTQSGSQQSIPATELKKSSSLPYGSPTTSVTPHAPDSEMKTKSKFRNHFTDIFLLNFGVFGVALTLEICICVPWATSILQPHGSCTNSYNVPIAVIGIVVGFFLLCMLLFLLKRRVVRLDITKSHEHWTTRWPTRTVYGTLLLVVYGGLFIISVLSVSIIFLHNTTPFYSRTYTEVGGLDGNVRIVRGEQGDLAPTVYAETLPDALFGQGFVHAQDRLSQIELLRLFSKGSLSSVFGKHETALDLDKQAKIEQYDTLGAAVCSALDLVSQQLLTAYVGGINTYIENNPQPSIQTLFYINALQIYKPDPFAVNDICSIWVLISSQLSEDRVETQRWQRLFELAGLAGNGANVNGQRLYDSVEAQLSFWEHYYDSNFTQLTSVSTTDIQQYQSGVNLGLVLNNDVTTRRNMEAQSISIERNVYSTFYNSWSTTARTSSQQPFEAEMSLNDFGLRSTLTGSSSTAWVAVDGSETFTAANNQFQSSFPNRLYAVRMRVNTQNLLISGEGFAGLPGIMQGSTSNILFNFSLAKTDVSDLFVLTPDPSNPTTHYIHSGSSIAYAERLETVHVRGASAVRFIVRESIYGPLINELRAYSEISDLPIAKFHSGLRRTPEILSSFSAYLQILRVTTVQDFESMVALRMGTPAAAFVVSDQSGTVGYFLTGSYHTRAQGHTGRYPIPGNGTFDYLNGGSTLPMAYLPRIVRLRPNAGAVYIAANQVPYPLTYRYTLGMSYEPYFRARCVSEVLSAPGRAQSNDGSISLHQNLLSDVRSNVWTFLFLPFFQTQEGISFLTQCTLLSEIITWDGFVSDTATLPTLFWNTMEEFSHQGIEEALINLSNRAVVVTTFPSLNIMFVFKLLQSSSGRLIQYCRTAPKLPSERWDERWGRRSVPDAFFSSRNLNSSLFPRCFGHATTNASREPLGDVSAIFGLAAPFNDSPLFSTVLGTTSVSLSVNSVNGTSHRYAMLGGDSENVFSSQYNVPLTTYISGTVSPNFDDTQSEGNDNREEILLERAP